MASMANFINILQDRELLDSVVRCVQRLQSKQVEQVEQVEPSDDTSSSMLSQFISYLMVDPNGADMIRHLVDSSKVSEYVSRTFDQG
jgi:hypothetical protein